MPAAAIARIIAPLALLVVLVSVVVVVASGGGDAAPEPTAATTTTTETTRTPRTYRVRSGDALSEIAARYDLTVQDLTDLNPEIDAQALQAGQRLKLRR